MARTAPTWTGSGTFVRVSFAYIDANGQLGSDSYITTPARATVANVEAAAVALGAATNANLYQIGVENINSALAPDPSLATESPRESVKDNVVTLYRNNVTRQTQDVDIPAPFDELMVAGTNDPDPTNALLIAVWAAFENLLDPAYSSISVRFAEHKGVNKKVRVPG